MKTGIVKWFNKVKGFGFIQAEGVENDIFAHFSEIQSEGFRNLKEGQKVQFELVDTDKGPLAHKITPIE